MPKKELLEFEKITLGSGESKELVFNLPISKLWYWNENTHARDIAKGKYEFCVFTRDGQMVWAENGLEIK